MYVKNHGNNKIFLISKSIGIEIHMELTEFCVSRQINLTFLSYFLL